MSPEKITFENLPNAVSQILVELDSLKTLVSKIIQPATTVRAPIGIDEAAGIVQKSKSTLYKLVNQKKIPCYKAGKKLYFFEDELLKWILDGKSTTCLSTLEDVGKSILINRRKRR